MNNNQVAHLWANQSKSQARGSNLFFDGDTIYSYGHHFPIARIVTNPLTKQDCVLFTTRSYSVSTAKHKRCVASACSHLQIFYVEDVTAEVKGKRAFAKLEKLEKERVQQEMEHKQKLAEKRAKCLAKQVVNYPAELLAWRNGGNFPKLAYQMPVALRLLHDGKTIETTKGARITIEDGKRTFQFLQTVKAKGWHRNGDSFAIGDFQLDAVNNQGIVAGCHRISWEEIEFFAKSQNWL